MKYVTCFDMTYCVLFSPESNGDYLVTASYDGTAKASSYWNALLCGDMGVGRIWGVNSAFFQVVAKSVFQQWWNLNLLPQNEEKSILPKR